MRNTLTSRTSVLALVLTLASPAWAQSTPAQVADMINTLLPSNSSGRVTAEVLRQVLLTMNASGLAVDNNLSDLGNAATARANLFPAGTIVGSMLANGAIADAQVASAAAIQGSKLQQPLSIGTGVAPNVGNAISTIGSWSIHSNVITVASVAGLAPGMTIIATGFPSSQIGTIAGSTITMLSGPGYPTPSPAAGASNVPVTFGQSRWDAGSTELVNSLGAKTAWLGDAALHGNSAGWIEGVIGQAVYPLTPIIATAPVGGIGQAAIFGARTSGATSSGGSINPLQVFAVVDTTTINGNPVTATSFGLYVEGDLLVNVPRHTLVEFSTYNGGAAAMPGTPYNYAASPGGYIATLAVDNGKGYASNPISTHLLLDNNGGQSYSVISIGYNAGIVDGGGIATAMGMAAGYSFDWFYTATPTPNDNSNPGVKTSRIYSVATAANAGNLVFNNGFINTSSGTDFASGGHVYGSQGTAPVLSSCGTSPSLSDGASDTQGTITEGTTATGCTLTFTKAFALTPSCVVTAHDSGVPVASIGRSSSALQITNTSSSGKLFSYVCLGA